MTNVLGKRSTRWLIYGVLAIALVTLNGCKHRETNNPFVGPFGDATSKPFGG